MLPSDLSARLAEVATLPRVVLASDFDGTLAPFVENPMDAAPVEGAMDLLAEAATLDGVTVALVSGRDLDTLRTLSGVADGGRIDLIGSHGGQCSRTDLVGSTAALDDEARSRLAHLEEQLEVVRDRHPGSRIERKPAAVALHTRGLPDEVAGPALADAALLGAQDGVHPLEGKSVVELGVIETSKGVALQALRAAVDADCVVYLGDDVTDERAFAHLPASEGHVTVKVGEGETAAAYRVSTIADVVDVLREFVRTRSGR